MKLTKRNTHKRVISGRISSPETRRNPETGKRELLLSYIDDRSNQQHFPTTKELFLFAAGDNSEGQLPEGLDRLSFHKFVIHVNKEGVAIGLDIIPARMYRARVVPLSQKDVTTVRFEWELDGAVCRVTNRPPNTKAEVIIDILKEVDKIISSGKAITTSTRIKNLGKVVDADGDSFEVKLNANKVSTPSPYDINVDDDDEEG